MYEELSGSAVHDVTAHHVCIAAIEVKLPYELINEGRRYRVRLGESLCQVKGKRGLEWVFDDVRTFVGEDTDFVILVDLEGPFKPRRYVVPAGWLRDHIIAAEQNFRDSKPDGKRPRNNDTHHGAIKVEQVAEYLERWDLLYDAARPAA